MKLKGIIQLIRLGFRRNKSKSDYQALQVYLAKGSILELERRGINLSEASVLELAAGSGGYSHVLRKSSRFFVTVDLHREGWVSGSLIPFVQVNLCDPLPIGRRTFDLVYCSSLIEHIRNPADLLFDVWRVLKPNGILYLSFPPFYSLALIGGHQFKPFHFLGETIAIKWTNRIRGTNFQGYANAYEDHGLYPRTIDEVKKMILQTGFEMMDIFPRMLDIQTTQLPGILKDLLTWHVCYLAKKVSSGTE
jgi:SAM-dependent methyltransferase